jgi:hypothetical protein
MALGVTIGRSEDSDDEDSFAMEAHRTLGVIGRIGLGARLSAQLELQQLDVPYNDTQLRGGTLLLAVDLLAQGRLMPMLFAGAGLDHTTFLTFEVDSHHVEAGPGLEYRARNGLFLTGDLRLGRRAFHGDQIFLLGGDVLVVPGVSEGWYQALRLNGGVRF